MMTFDDVKEVLNGDCGGSLERQMLAAAWASAWSE